jgi:hypothetical protein
MDSKDDIKRLDEFFSCVSDTIYSLQKRAELLEDPELQDGISNLRKQMAQLKEVCAVMQTEWLALNRRFKNS